MMLLHLSSLSSLLLIYSIPKFENRRLFLPPQIIFAPTFKVSAIWTAPSTIHHPITHNLDHPDGLWTYWHNWCNPVSLVTLKTWNQMLWKKKGISFWKHNVHLKWCFLLHWIPPIMAPLKHTHLLLLFVKRNIAILLHHYMSAHIQ